MKTLSFILFTAFYALSSAGFSVNLHYCLGEFSEMEFFVHKTQCCCGDEAPMASCCDDETLILETGEDQVVTQYNIEFNSVAGVSGLLYSNNLDIESLESEQTLFKSESPPIRHQPIWLVNCRLTYYG